MNIEELIYNKEPLIAVYGKMPSLRDIDLFEIIFARDGPTVSLRFDLLEYPAKPPAKWAAQGYNQVQLTLVCFGLFEVHQQGWGYSNTAKLTATTLENGSKQVSVKGSTISLHVTCDFISVEKVTAYLKEAEQE